MNPMQRVGAAAVEPLVRIGAAVGDALDSVRGGMVFARQQWGLNLLLGRTRIDYQREVGDPTRNSIVVAAVGWIARTFPQAPVRIQRVAADGKRTTVQPSLTGPGWVLRLWRHPNPFFSGTLMARAIVVDLFTGGNAYVVKVRDAYGRVAALWWVPRKLMAAIGNESTFIAHYEYNPNGVPYIVAVEDVIHFREGIDPDNPRAGLSRLGSLFREIYTDDEAANFTAQLLANLGVPGVILAPSNTTTTARTDPEAVKRSFMEKFGGDKRGEPMVLTSPTDVKVLSWNPEQMNLRELRKIPEERITAVLGVSAIVAGLGAGLDRSTFTNFGEARKAAFEESVSPLHGLVADVLLTQLLDEFVDLDRETYELDFDTSRVAALQEDAEKVWRRTESSATKGLITRAAFKRANGLPVEDGDEIYVKPNNYDFINAAESPVRAGLLRPAE